MKRLHQLGPQEILAKHRELPARQYEEDYVQRPRILLAREFVKGALLDMNHGREGPPHERRTIIELGCGACEISGYFSWGHNVRGYDCGNAGVLAGKAKWPWVEFEFADVTKLEPAPCDLLVLCETLEHMPDPTALTKAWLPMAKYCLISSPLDGDLQGDSSGGEHVWSFSEGDLTGFFEPGGHELIKQQNLRMGSYLIWVGLGRKFPEKESARTQER